MTDWPAWILEAAARRDGPPAVLGRLEQVAAEAQVEPMELAHNKQTDSVEFPGRSLAIAGRPILEVTFELLRQEKEAVAARQVEAARARTLRESVAKTFRNIPKMPWRR